ncbi:hypothetical protein CVT26_003196 [Gymnopilus dilepis]|uniref:Uncharacterized protein n=1 Tax=Gymnopilus dilepis TaxID=231916 RepID=A0A409Y566_9AGAR|nr:hypothetical protein CVT26_003196 [Gymnopilus dilepis]
MYAQAQKMAKEQATSGVNMLKEVQEKLREMYDQELKFEKLEEDCRLPSLTHDVCLITQLRRMTEGLPALHLQEIFEQLQELYNPMYNELRNRRREKISDISRMLQTNGPSRQEALKEMSKKTRRQLEQAKLREKEASDAAELIKRVKNMLRV